MRYPFKRKEKSKDKRPSGQIAFIRGDKDWCCPEGYTRLEDNPEVMTACRKIASLIASTTIYLMANTKNGDERIINELSRKIDIDPMPTMTRSSWMEAIVMNLLLYGKGNSIVAPHTWQSTIQSLEPISASRVSFVPAEGSYRDYKVQIDGKDRRPESLLHFTLNPDPIYLWKGRGLQISLKDLADALAQAAATEKSFMRSDYKPSLIVMLDADDEGLAQPEGREIILDDYVRTARAGDPWVLPSSKFKVEQVKPLSLADLAIKDTVELDKKMIAAVVGVPAFVLGVGSYNKDEWNSFIASTIMTISKSIAQEMTKKLITSPSMYLQFNVWSLMDYNLAEKSSVMLAGADRGFINGDEWRDAMHLSPAGLKEFKILENYIPYEDSGNQKKLEN